MLDDGAERVSGARARLRRRAFSLIEMVIAIAILGALTGLVMPAAQSWMESERFAGAAGQLPAALSIARAEARRDGAARRVTAMPGDDGRVAIIVETMEASGGTVLEEDVGGGSRSGMGTQGSAGAGGSGPTLSSPPARTLMELPVGCRIVMGVGAGAGIGAESAEAGAGTSNGGDERATGGRVTEPVGMDEPVTLVVYLPDGGAIAPATSTLVGPGGRSAVIRFDRWTGRAHVGEKTGAVAASERSEETPDDPEVNEADGDRAEPARTGTVPREPGAGSSTGSEGETEPR